MATNKDFIVKNGLSVGEDISVSGSVTSNLQFDDSVQIKLGTDSDLLIYHDGSHARLREVTGEFRIQTTSGGVNAFVAKQNAEVELFHAGSVMLATTATGVDITGNAVLSGELRGPASFVIDPATVGNNTGAVVIKGDLTVEGTTTTVNSTTLNVADINITVANGAADAAAANGGGITIAGAGAIFAWNNALGSMTLNKELRLDNNKGLFFANAAGNATVGLKADTSDNITFRQNGTWDRLVIKNTGVDVSGIMTASGNIVTTANVSAGTYTGITLGGSLSGNYTDAKVQYGNSFVGTAAQGHFFFDALNQKLKVYTGSAFVDAVPASGGGGGGSGSSDATATFRKYTYTLASSTNAVSGMEDDIVATTNFISGRKYQITTVGNTDFTAIGAGSNAGGVVFISTGVGGGTTGRAREVLFYATGGTQNIEVYVNGVKAVEGSSNDYVATTGTSVTFTSNLAVGDVVDVQVYELLTNDSYYLKSEVYTQAQVNSQITTGTSSYLPLVGGELTGNVTLEKSANSTFTVIETGAGAVTIQGTGSGGRVYSNSGNKLLLGGGGQNSHLIIDTNGNVGIGTDNPQNSLHVNSASDQATIRLTSADNSFARIYFGDQSDGVRGRVEYDNNDDALIFGTNDVQEHVRIDAIGKVGIGTDVPGHPLDVDGDINARGTYRTDQVRHTVRPILNFDFVNTKTLDSKISFSRRSIATYYGERGYIKYANVNEPRLEYDASTGEPKGLLVEEAMQNIFTHTTRPEYWPLVSAAAPMTGEANSELAPDGRFSATKLTARNTDPYWYQNGLTLNGTYTFSYWLKGFGNAVGKHYTARIINVSSNQSNAGTIPAVWTRYSHTFTTTSTTTAYVGLEAPDNSAAIGDQLSIWGAQLELNSNMTSYIPSDDRFDSRSTTASYYGKDGLIKYAAANEPRYGYRWDGRNIVETGLIAERTSTNLATYSEDLSYSSWLKTAGAVVKDETVTAPDGSTNVWAFVSSTANTSHNIREQHSGLSSNYYYTLSYWIKAKGSQTESGVYNAGPGSSITITDLNTAAPSIATNGTVHNASATYDPNSGWIRVEYTTVADSSGVLNPIFTCRQSGGEAHAGDGTQGIYIWGYQLELGNSATSYIRAIGATFTRAADVITSTAGTRKADEVAVFNLSDYVDTSEDLTSYVHASTDFVPQQNARYYEMTDIQNTTDDRIISYYNVQYRVLREAGNVNYGVYQSTTDYSDLSEIKQASAYTKDSTMITADSGGFVITDSTPGPNMKFDNIYLGSDYTFTQQLGGHIKKFSLYNKALSSSEIVALTENN